MMSDDVPEPKSSKAKRSWGILLTVLGALALIINATSTARATRTPAEAIGALSVGVILLAIGITLLVRSRSRRSM